MVIFQSCAVPTLQIFANHISHRKISGNRKHVFGQDIGFQKLYKYKVSDGTFPDAPPLEGHVMPVHVHNLSSSDTAQI